MGDNLFAGLDLNVSTLYQLRIREDQPMSDAGLKSFFRLPRFLGAGCCCRRCSSIRFRSAEPERLDAVLALLTLESVRCVNCGCRYYWFRRTSANGGKHAVQRIKLAEQKTPAKGK